MKIRKLPANFFITLAPGVNVIKTVGVFPTTMTEITLIMALHQKSFIILFREVTMANASNNCLR
jgi:hypothetical protein